MLTSHFKNSFNMEICTGAIFTKHNFPLHVSEVKVNSYGI